MAENFFKFLSLSLYEKEKKESTIPFLFPIIINNTFQKRIKTERFLSEKKKRETNFNQNRQQKKKKKKDAYSSQHSISLPIKFLRQSDHAFEQESILHFVLHPPPVLYVFRHVHYYPIYRAERRQQNRHRERERDEWRKITNERGVEKRGGWKRWLIIFLPFPPKIHANSGHACLVERELSSGDDLWRARFMRPNPADVFTLVLEKIYRRPPIPMGENDPETFVGQLARRYRSPLHGYRFELRTTHVRLMIESLNSSLHEIYI